MTMMYPLITENRDMAAVCADVCADYAAGPKAGGTQWEIAKRHDVSLVWEGIAHLAHGIPNRWKNPREGAELKFDQDDIAEHWRTVHGQELPQGR
jgi:hypothetical protein